MTCCKCGAQISQDAGFCPQCGCEQAHVKELKAQCLADIEQCKNLIAKGQSSTDYITANISTRLEQWKQAADIGLPEAQWLLARCFDEGLGIERNSAEAVNLYEQAAGKGYAPAQYAVGYRCQSGLDMPQDKPQAARWYQKAACQGYAPAQSSLGWCYDTGFGMQKNDSEAVKWYSKAAEQGDDTAQYNLAVHYEHGKGADLDTNEAMKWYRKAAEQGYEQAKSALQRFETQHTPEPVHAQPITISDDTEQKFRQACIKALEDGKLTADEKDELIHLAERFGISREMRNKLFDEEKTTFLAKHRSKINSTIEQQFRQACREALADGKLTVDEKHDLKELALKLNLPGEVVKLLFEEEKKIFLSSHKKHH
ncbi:MAG: hypothetical protein ABIG61_04870 [Planctomycetota bacterium]